MVRSGCTRRLGRKGKRSRSRAGERRPEGAGELRSPESEMARPRGAGTLRRATGSRRWRCAGGYSTQQPQRMGGRAPSPCGAGVCWPDVYARAEGTQGVLRGCAWAGGMPLGQRRPEAD